MSRQKTHEEYVAELSQKRMDVVAVEKYIKSNVPIMHKFLNCGHEYKIAPNQVLSGGGCGVCHGLTVVPGVNDCATTRPDLVKFFVNPSDAQNVTECSGQRLQFKCTEPGCSYAKQMRVADLNWYGFSCPIHDDGISFPEKVMIGVLKQLNVDFIHDKSRPWSNGKRYDFILEKYNVIIETHGSQHYEHGFRKVSDQSLNDVQNNDKIKEKMAAENNIELIVIDCRVSDLEYIKNNILNSKVNIMFNLSKIDWKEIAEYAYSSLVEQAIEFWDLGYSISQIAEKIMVDSNTVRKYLKSASKAGICNYTKKESKLRGVRLNSGKYNSKSKNVCLCSTDDKPLIIWESRLQAAKELDIQLECIRLNCNGKIRHAGNLLWKDLSDIERFNEFSQEYLDSIKRENFTKEQVCKIAQNNKYYFNSVVCFDDRLCIHGVWDSPTSAEKETGIAHTHIIDSCYGKTITAGGYHWLYVYDHYNQEKNHEGALSKGIIDEQYVRNALTIQN